MVDFPIWLAFALISPLCWAIVHVLDAFCVHEVFDFPWIGCVTSALATLCAYPILILAGLIFVEFQTPGLNLIALAIAAGFIMMLGQFFYFQSLSYSEPGIVAAYWNMLPIFLPVISFFIFGEMFTRTVYVGMTLLIFSSVSFSLLDSNLEHRWHSLALMFCAVWLQVAYFLLQKKVFEFMPVYYVFLLTMLGVITAGLMPLLTQKGRQVFKANLPKIQPAFKFILMIEVFNLAAYATSQYAISHGSPSLVAAVESSLPAYCFGLSILLYFVFGKYGEAEAKHKLTHKLSLAAIMAIGVWMVS
ncbi:MAG: EamA family transporter [Blastocatellales bacterium]